MWTVDQTGFKSKTPQRTLCTLTQSREIIIGYMQPESSGTRFVGLLETTKELLVLAESLEVALHPFYIPGHYNAIADSLLRGNLLPDWHSKKEITILQQVVGDLFNGSPSLGEAIFESRPKTESLKRHRFKYVISGIT
ncbi:putative reverse transcriptase/ribonuclease H/putative methyltransferase-like protein [Operophtera brumata]|uniref:Putative reverse transcriptase/ribonuclease H/putative methyltransferase-like protein n=1 Tax=Operophtera brumata TaxID=104452 RepID=A0A0L7KLX2_OPEBR|nr:putative reverse transcriptase/ribonuclease H/putative methyltransferase-like protein [Operophtera brumata]